MGTSVVLINLSIVSSFIGNQRDYFALLALIVTFQVGWLDIPAKRPKHPAALDHITSCVPLAGE